MVWRVLLSSGLAVLLISTVIIVASRGRDDLKETRQRAALPGAVAPVIFDFEAVHRRGDDRASDRWDDTPLSAMSLSHERQFPPTEVPDLAERIPGATLTLFKSAWAEFLRSRPRSPQKRHMNALGTSR